MTGVSSAHFSVAWEVPNTTGTYGLSGYMLWACDVGSHVCTSRAVDADKTRTTVDGLPSGRNFTLAVEALTLAGSSGNKSVEGQQPGFTTHAPPDRANAPFAAPQVQGLNNESLLHVMWWPPFGNGLPLLTHELLIDAGTEEEGELAAIAAARAGSRGPHRCRRRGMGAPAPRGPGGGTPW